MKICGEEGSESDYDYPDGLLLPPPSSPSPSQLTRSPRLDSSPGLDCWSESVIRVSDLTSLCKQTETMGADSEGQTHPAGQGTAGPPLPACWACPSRSRSSQYSVGYFQFVFCPSQCRPLAVSC